MIFPPNLLRKSRFSCRSPPPVVFALILRRISLSRIGFAAVNFRIRLALGGLYFIIRNTFIGAADRGSHVLSFKV